MAKISLEDAAKEWLELKKIEKATEARLEELKEVLAPALRRAPDQVRELAGHAFKLVSSTRENFSLKKALEKLGRRTLSPFITTSDVESIRTTPAAAAEDVKAAA